MSKHQIILFIVINLSISNTMAKDKLSFSTGATYITGKYGTSESTDIYYVPLSLKYKFKKLTFKLTVPYLEKTGSKNVIKDLGKVGQQLVTKRTTETGLGDISAALRYNFYYNQNYKFLIDAEGKVNIGTASVSKGLGTGKTDYSFRLGLYKVFDQLTPYSKIGFKVYAHPRLNDVFFASAGLVYKFTPSIAAGIDYSWREKVSRTSAEKNQLTGFSSQKLTKNWTIQEYIIKGFSRSTADWGGGISINYGFDL